MGPAELLIPHGYRRGFSVPTRVEEGPSSAASTYRHPAAALQALPQCEARTTPFEHGENVQPGQKYATGRVYTGAAGSCSTF